MAVNILDKPDLSTCICLNSNYLLVDKSGNPVFLKIQSMAKQMHREQVNYKFSVYLSNKDINDIKCIVSFYSQQNISLPALLLALFVEDENIQTISASSVISSDS